MHLRRPAAGAGTSIGLPAAGRRESSALTLVELLVVVAIMALVRRRLSPPFLQAGFSRLALDAARLDANARRPLKRAENRQ